MSNMPLNIMKSAQVKIRILLLAGVGTGQTFFRRFGLCTKTDRAKRATNKVSINYINAHFVFIATGIFKSKDSLHIHSTIVRKFCRLRVYRNRLCIVSSAWLHLTFAQNLCCSGSQSIQKSGL